MKPCDRCKWQIWLPEHPCACSPWAALFCEQHDYIFFEDRIIELDQDEYEFEDEDLIEDSQ